MQNNFNSTSCSLCIVEDSKSDGDKVNSPKVSQDLESTSMAGKTNTTSSNSHIETSRKRKSSFNKSARKSRKKSRVQEVHSGDASSATNPIAVEGKSCFDILLLSFTFSAR